ncbi:MAG: hypothetical protein ACXWUG_01050 [Polyangiales bacterium]
MRSLFTVALFASVFAGCAVPADQDDGSSAATEGHLKGGCRLVCPKCRAGEVCAMWACFEDCNAADAAQCVDNMLCPEGYRWSRGQCSCVSAKKSSTCVETMMCIQGYVWSSTACDCVPQ